MNMTSYVRYWKLITTDVHRVPADKLTRLQLFAAIHGSGIGLAVLAVIIFFTHHYH